MEGKGKLEFELPKQEIDFRVAVRSMDLAIFILDIELDLYKKAKYGEDSEKWDELKVYFNNKILNSGISDLIRSIP